MPLSLKSRIFLRFQKKLCRPDSFEDKLSNHIFEDYLNFTTKPQRSLRFSINTPFSSFNYRTAFNDNQWMATTIWRKSLMFITYPPLIITAHVKQCNPSVSTTFHVFKLSQNTLHNQTVFQDTLLFLESLQSDRRFENILLQEKN